MKDVTENVVEILKGKRVVNEMLFSAHFLVSETKLFVLSKTKFQSDYIEEKFDEKGVKYLFYKKETGMSLFQISSQS